MQLPIRGPFYWKLSAGEADRTRLLLHRATVRAPSALRLRGGPRIALCLRRLVGDYHQGVVASSPDIALSFDGFDGYWMSVFFRGDLYEPELFRLFKRIRDVSKFDFIDGGANIGYWSALLTCKLFGVRKAVAVEASPSTYVHLRTTAALCANRFETEHRALTKECGHVTFEQGLPHASRRISNRNGTASVGDFVTVEATSVADVIARHGLSSHDLLIKLDVEGAELDCILGASDAFEAGAFFVYEDHGRDKSSMLTGKLLEHGALCWFISDDGALHPVSSAGAASSFKPDRTRGYNFICVSASSDARDPALKRLFGE